jgi:hypothetical protein
VKKEGGALEYKEKNMEISLLGGLNNESNKKNKIRIRVVKEKKRWQKQVRDDKYTSLE